MSRAGRAPESRMSSCEAAEAQHNAAQHTLSTHPGPRAAIQIPRPAFRHRSVRASNQQQARGKPRGPIFRAWMFVRWSSAASW